MIHEFFLTLPSLVFLNQSASVSVSVSVCVRVRNCANVEKTTENSRNIVIATRATVLYLRIYMDISYRHGTSNQHHCRRRRRRHRRRHRRRGCQMPPGKQFVNSLGFMYAQTI